MPKTQWLHYGGNPLGRTGSYVPEGDTHHQAKQIEHQAELQHSIRGVRAATSVRRARHAESSQQSLIPNTRPRSSAVLPSRASRGRAPADTAWAAPSTVRPFLDLRDECQRRIEVVLRDVLNDGQQIGAIRFAPFKLEHVDSWQSGPVLQP